MAYVNTACAGHVTIFSTGGKFHPGLNLTKLHALTLAARSYSSRPFLCALDYAIPQFLIFSSFMRHQSLITLTVLLHTLKTTKSSVSRGERKVCNFYNNSFDCLLVRKSGKGRRGMQQTFLVLKLICVELRKYNQHQRAGCE